MTAAEYLVALAVIGMNQTQAARLLDYDARTLRRWESSESQVPTAVATLLRIMIAHHITPERATEIGATDNEARHQEQKPAKGGLAAFCQIALDRLYAGWRDLSDQGYFLSDMLLGAKHEYG